MAEMAMWAANVASVFRSWSLSRQFAAAGGPIILGVAALAGMIASSIVTRNTVEGTASWTALLMESFLSRHVQVLSSNELLPPEASAAIDRLLESDRFGQRFPHLEIWKPDGLIAYSRRGELTGQRFEPPDGLVAALRGEVAARFTDLDAREHVARRFDQKYLEIYVPVRADNSERIIAVAEIHEAPEVIKGKLFHARLQAWLATGALTVLVMASLFGIVHRGSRTIHLQQEALRKKVAEVQEISDQNRILKERSQCASARLAEMNAKYLRKVGADLHDGPAQLIGLAALRVEHVRRARNAAARNRELDALDLAVEDALRDIRTISKGLLLPEIKDLPLCEVIELVATAHEKRTATKVTMDCDKVGDSFTHAVKICVYRFVQESLNNAFKHAGGAGQRVVCSVRDGMLTVSVSDAGIGQAGSQPRPEAGLGLTMMRDRVESLGGTLNIQRELGKGTKVEMRLAMGEATGNGWTYNGDSGGRPLAVQDRGDPDAASGPRHKSSWRGRIGGRSC